MNYPLVTLTPYFPTKKHTPSIKKNKLALLRENGQRKDSKFEPIMAYIYIFGIIILLGYFIAGAVSIHALNNIIKNIMP